MKQGFEPSLAQLRALVAFTNSKSMTAAADSIGVKRSTLWAQLHRFQEEIELELSEQLTREQVRPSAMAHLLKEPAERILKIAEELERLVTESAHGVLKGTLTIASYPAPVARFAARAASQFQVGENSKWGRISVRYEGLDDRFRESGGDYLITLLLDGAADIAIAPATSTRRAPRLESVPLYKAHLCAYDPSHIALKSPGPLEISNLEHVPLLVAPRTSQSRRLLVELLRADGCFPDVFVESPSVEALRGLADAGHGIAILPCDALDDAAISGDDVAPLITKNKTMQNVPYRLYSLASSGDGGLREALRALKDSIIKEASEYDLRVSAMLGIGAEGTHLKRRSRPEKPKSLKSRAR